MYNNIIFIINFYCRENYQYYFLIDNKLFLLTLFLDYYN